MAGQPLKRKCLHALDQHEEEIFEKLAAGEFVTDLCREYLAEPYEEEGRGEPANWSFYTWLDDEPGRRERFDRVRETAADAVAEESIRLLDEAREEGVSSTAEATLAKAQSNSRQWWASKLNQLKYGNRPDVETRVSIGELHLNALRKFGQMPNRVPVEEVQEAEYELEEGENPRDRYAGKSLGEIPGD